jgi:hypothetical protein
LGILSIVSPKKGKPQIPFLKEIVFVSYPIFGLRKRVKKNAKLSQI